MLVRNSTFNEKFPYLALALLLVFGVIQIAWGERIPINDGLGWDGQAYAKYTMEFPGNVLRHELGPFSVQRIFPSAVVNLGLRMLGLEISKKNVIKGFTVYNLVLLLTGSIIWSFLAEDQKLSGRSKWLGLCFLFVNFPVLKLTFYYAVLTDTTALTLGLWLAYCFLKRNSLGILLAAIVGAFTWPTLLYSSLLLYLFPNTNSANKPPISPVKHKLNTAVAIACCTAVLVVLIYVHYGRHIQSAYGADQVNESLILLSSLIVVGYVFGVLRHLLDFDDLFNLKAIRDSLRPSRLILVVIVFLMIKVLIAVLNHGANGVRGDTDTFVYLVAFDILRSVAKPAIFLLSHLIYFGPVVLFFWFRFGTFSRVIHAHGIGLTLYFVFYLMLALDSESRHLIDAFPFLVILVTMFMDKLPWKAVHGWIILASCLLFSKIWLPINNQPLTGNILTFPFQYLFMNLGPWMSALSYVIQLILAILIGGFLFLALRAVLFANPLMKSIDPEC